MKTTVKFFLVLLVFVNVSCSSEQEEKKSKKVSTPIVQAIVQDTIPIKEEVGGDTPVLVKELKLNQEKNSSKTKAFLKQPFDFFKFKKKVRGANTTTSYNYKKFFKPNHKGFFFTYFVFQGCQPRGLQISVYKEGYEMGKFSDKDETVICVKSECDLKALGNLNLVGKPLSYLEENIGKNYI